MVFVALIEPGAHIDRPDLFEGEATHERILAARTLQVVIMENDETPVLSLMNVEFQSFGAHLKGQAEGGLRILRSIGARTPVRDDLHESYRPAGKPDRAAEHRARRLIKAA